LGKKKNLLALFCIKNDVNDYIMNDIGKINVEFFYFASSFGNVELLAYLHEKGCPWNEKCCYYASTNGINEMSVFI